MPKLLKAPRNLFFFDKLIFNKLQLFEESGNQSLKNKILNYQIKA